MIESRVVRDARAGVAGARAHRMAAGLGAAEIVAVWAGARRGPGKGGAGAREWTQPSPLPPRPAAGGAPLLFGWEGRAEAHAVERDLRAWLEPSGIYLSRFLHGAASAPRSQAPPEAPAADGLYPPVPRSTVISNCCAGATHEAQISATDICSSGGGIQVLLCRATDDRIHNCRCKVLCYSGTNFWQPVALSTRCEEEDDDENGVDPGDSEEPRTSFDTPPVAGGGGGEDEPDCGAIQTEDDCGPLPFAGQCCDFLVTSTVAPSAIFGSYDVPEVTFQDCLRDSAREPLVRRLVEAAWRTIVANEDAARLAMCLTGGEGQARALDLSSITEIRVVERSALGGAWLNSNVILLSCKALEATVVAGGYSKASAFDVSSEEYGSDVEFSDCDVLKWAYVLLHELWHVFGTWFYPHMYPAGTHEVTCQMEDRAARLFASWISAEHGLGCTWEF